MSDLDALLAGIVADPHNALRWLVMADWLEDHGQPERAELVRVHRELLRTCTEPDTHPERPQLHARMMELMRSGVPPCLPQRTLDLPGGVGLPMVFVPPGSFLMGSPDSETRRESNERRHLVTLTRGFWLGQTPVTQSQWTAVLGENPSRFKGDELPVESVSWDDVQSFFTAVRRQTGWDARLPSEAEWESAARAGTTTPFYWGAELNGTQANCDGNRCLGTEVEGPHLNTTTVVGRYSEVSPHPWELADVIGNVWEWCADWYAVYPVGKATDPRGPDIASHRVCRGGSWSSRAWGCRVACRSWRALGGQGRDVGFRLAATSSDS